VIARFRPGDLDDADKVDDLRLALIQTQLFGGVTVVPEDSGARAPDGTAITDIRVDAGRGPKRQWAGQVGYSTGEGARVDLQWRHRNLVVPEGGFTALGVIGTREQRVGASLAMANWGQRDRTLTTMFDVANVNRPAFQARTATAAATLARASTPIFQKRWTWSAGAELIASDELDRSFDPNAPRQTYLIAALPLALGYDRSNSLLDPTGGWRAGLRVSPEFSQQGGNTSTYLRLTGDVSGYQQLSDPLVLAARARVASILGAQRIDIAPTRRLYAGGGGSVRGYDYQDVGPLGADDRPLGGRALTEGSVEARYRFGDFGVVAFVDAGTLTESSTPTLSDVHVGAGIGGRYYTSFGPIRVDVARALNNRTRAPAFALYISIGQAF
jgi:translocation and assembly module TamA